MSQQDRHPSASWDRVPPASTLPTTTPAFAGVTNGGMTRWVVAGLALLLAGCAAVAEAQQAEAPPAAPAPAPAGQRGGGPMPQPVTLAQRPAASGGEALFVEHCITCHGPVGMGTGLLERRGRPEPQLERRGDLAAAFVVLAARNGIGNMPAIPRGEVTDTQLQAIADYLDAGPHGGQP